MNSKDLIHCANTAEDLRKALHKKDKMSYNDCKEYRLGVLRVLWDLGFIRDHNEALNIVNLASAIDADLLLEPLNKKKSEIAKGRYTDGFNDAIMRVRSMVSSASTVEVVPKSEVEKLKQDLEIAEIAINNRNIELEAMRTAANSYKMHYENLAREIFEEIESRLLNYIADYHGCYHKTFDELKKKYVGGK